MQSQPPTKAVGKFCPVERKVVQEGRVGKGDFEAVVAKLNSLGFNGPNRAEGVKVSTTTEATSANREFLVKVLASMFRWLARIKLSRHSSRPDVLLGALHPQPPRSTLRIALAAKIQEPQPR